MTCKYFLVFIFYFKPVMCILNVFILTWVITLFFGALFFGALFLLKTDMVVPYQLPKTCMVEAWISRAQCRIWVHSKFEARFVKSLFLSLPPPCIYTHIYMHICIQTHIYGKCMYRKDICMWYLHILHGIYIYTHYIVYMCRLYVYLYTYILYMSMFYVYALFINFPYMCIYFQYMHRFSIYVYILYMERDRNFSRSYRYFI